MKTVQMTIDDALLSAVDHAAGQSQETRSAFIRVALQAELKRRQNAAMEEAHRQSFQAQPDDDAWQPARRAWGE
ncbi:CopG family transcriptional regulator [Deinococcus sp. AJ005]|uniref:ribbon-helix-helix domain-containing protein n=1 Tax=Deinococcus sp. AJ005 TaxID=2652443 RepID=UPI00125CB09E|nr:CopG family transcriptional regulator [Deinococcus sp. AJ005]QFP75786.1 ribbon-helix-helix protein, CopG family [Deinococcus sp. AJ005]